MIITKNNSVEYDSGQISNLSSFFKLDQSIIRLLFARGYKTKEQISDFLSPSAKKFYNPYLLKNMRNVVKTSSVMIKGYSDKR